jgi:hypothetical protein
MTPAITLSSYPVIREGGIKVSKPRCARRKILCLFGCALFMTGDLASAEPPSFAKLPHRTRPLVQAGSENLLPSPGFAAGTKGWETWGDVTLVEASGERCLRFGPKKGAEAARIRVYIPKPKGGTLYLLRFEVKMWRPSAMATKAPTPEVEFDWQADDQGLHGWLAHAAKGRNPFGATPLRETRRSDQWMPRGFRLFTDSKTDVLYILLGFSAVKGEALTRRWELVEEPVAATEGRVILETPSGEWAEMPHEPQPPAPSEPKIWVPSDPDRLTKNSRPKPAPEAQDLPRPLELAGTPDEMCVSAVGLYTPKPISPVALSFTKLTGEAGDLGATPTWKWVIYHPRRTDFYGRGRTFCYVPDFFIERAQGVSCAAGETTGFWINLRLPKDARPGLYEGRLNARADGLDLALPVKVRVYPFPLAQLAPNQLVGTGLADRTRHMYSDANRWKTMSDEQVLAELADVQDHGYESITLGCRGSMSVENGVVKGFQPSDEDVRGVRLVLRAGLKGPFLFWAGWLPDALASKLGLQAGVVKGTPDTWPAEIPFNAVEALKVIRAELIKIGVADPILVLVDEPGYWKKGSPERLLWDVKVAHKAGWPTFCTSSYLPSDPIGKGLEYHCYAGSRLYLDPQRAAFVAEQTRAAGQKLWYYCTGAYSGQIGNMVRNRYLGGFFFYRCGADGTASWTFQRPRGNAFDDFGIDARTHEPTTGQACITYPDPEHPGQNLDTPQWEGLRQAWYDHRYAETLRRGIAMARENKDPRADQAEKRLAELLAELPWNGDPFLWPELTNERLTRTRAAVADEIMKLQVH